MLEEGLGEEKEEEDGCFMLLGELIQLQFLCFGKKIISHTQDVILQIPTVRMWIIFLGILRQYLKMIQRLTNPE